MRTTTRRPATRQRPRRRMLAALSTVAALFTGLLVISAAPAVAQAAPCQENVYVYQTSSDGKYLGPNINSLGPSEISINTDDAAHRYIFMAGVTRPRRAATFRFVNEQGAVIRTYTTTSADDGGVIRQEPNVIPFNFTQPGQTVSVYADFRTRCGGDDVPVTNRYVGAIKTYPTYPVQANLKYLVVGVAYAPPGKSSSVDYGTTTTLGSKVSFSSSIQGNITQTNTSQVSPNREISSSTSLTQTAAGGFTDSIEKSASSDIIIPGPSDSLDGINHNEDLFFIWLNPSYTITRTGPTSVASSGYSVDPRDPISPNTDVVVLSVRQLKDPSLISPGDASRLQRSWSPTGALNRNDFNTILSYNPFANGGTAIDSARFDPVPGATFAYTPANTSGQPITQKYNVKLQQASTQSKTFTTQVKYDFSSTLTDQVLVAKAEGEVVGTFKDTNKVSQSLTATAGVTLDSSTGASQSTSLSLTGPTSGYQGPTAIRVYQDNLFGTLMFAYAPVATFQIGAPTPNQTVTQTNSASYPITTKSDFGFTGNVTFGAVSGLPAGARASFSPASVGVGNHSTLTVTTGLQTPPGTYPLTLTATSGLITRHLKVTLVIRAATNPSVVRSIKVAGTANAKTRQVTWIAPVSDGGARLVRYELVVKKGTKTVVGTVKLAPTKRAYTINTTRLKNGSYTVYVRAVNAKGASRWATRTFTVKR